MLQALTVRPANPSDATTVADVYLASRRTFLDYAPLAHTEDEVRTWIRDVVLPTQQVTIAEEGGRVVGMMALQCDDTSGWIEQLYLQPDAVGRGIGTILIDIAKATLGAPLRLYTFQANTGARRFYERHGFVPLELGDGSGNEENCPDVLYEWQNSV